MSTEYEAWAEDERQERITVFKTMICMGRSTCPTSNDRDLELWEIAYNEVRAEQAQPGDTKE